MNISSKLDQLHARARDCIHVLKQLLEQCLDAYNNAPKDSIQTHNKINERTAYNDAMTENNENNENTISP